MEIDRERIDLHIHTTASDGNFTPSQVIRHALEIGLRAVAITDHDTMGGVQEALEAGASLGMEVVPGVEISVDSGTGTCHLLGYFTDIRNRRLNHTLRKLRSAREDRNLLILERLRDIGLPLEMEHIKRVSGGGLVGRPHMAQAMYEMGYVKSVEEAFTKYLGKGKVAYVNKFRLSPNEAISLIIEAGGVPVLAHPVTLGLGLSWELESFIRELVKLGLKGVEVYYPDHHSGHVAILRSIAQRYHLIVTGGTDFHGTAKPDISMGTGRGEMSIPYSLLKGLKRVRDSLCP